MYTVERYVGLKSLSSSPSLFVTPHGTSLPHTIAYSCHLLPPILMVLLVDKDDDPLLRMFRSREDLGTRKYDDRE